MNRLFVISLGVILLAIGMLFLYFRNKVGKMEKKVDLMFQLIQEYDQQRLQAPPVQMTGGVGQSSDQMMMQVNMEDSQLNNPNLINVSDDDNTDSEEVSDSDDDDDNDNDDDNADDGDDGNDGDDQIQIGEEELAPIKSITLAGAEFGIQSDTHEDLNSPEQSDDLEEISDLEDDEEEDEKVGENVKLMDSEVQNPYSLNPDQIVEHLVDKLNKNTNTTKNIEVKEEKTFKDMSVKELKKLCKERGFTNISALRKPKLIELLHSASS